MSLLFALGVFELQMRTAIPGTPAQTIFREVPAGQVRSFKFQTLSDRYFCGGSLSVNPLTQSTTESLRVLKVRVKVLAPKVCDTPGSTPGTTRKKLSGTLDIIPSELKTHIYMSMEDDIAVQD
jgi:hypothetical protein